jgi:hypothetical protein
MRGGARYEIASLIPFFLSPVRAWEVSQLLAQASEADQDWATRQIRSLLLLVAKGGSLTTFATGPLSDPPAPSALRLRGPQTELVVPLPITEASAKLIIPIAQSEGPKCGLAFSRSWFLDAQRVGFEDEPWREAINQLVRDVCPTLTGEHEGAVAELQGLFLCEKGSTITSIAQPLQAVKKSLFALARGAVPTLGGPTVATAPAATAATIPTPAAPAAVGLAAANTAGGTGAPLAQAPLQATIEEADVVVVSGHAAAAAPPTLAPPPSAAREPVGMLLVQLPSQCSGGTMQVTNDKGNTSTLAFGCNTHSTHSTHSTHGTHKAHGSTTGLEFLVLTPHARLASTSLMSGYRVMLLYTLHSAPAGMGPVLGGSHDKLEDPYARGIINSRLASLPSFQKLSSEAKVALTRVLDDDYDEIPAAWLRLLRREPRAFVVALAYTLRQQQEHDGTHVPLVYYLEGLYTDAELGRPGLAALKGADRTVLEVLLAANALLPDSEKYVFMAGRAHRRIKERGMVEEARCFRPNSSLKITDTTTVTQLHLLDGRAVQGSLVADWGKDVLNTSRKDAWKKPTKVHVSTSRFVEDFFNVRNSEYERSALVLFSCNELSAVLLLRRPFEQLAFVCELATAAAAGIPTVSREIVIGPGLAHMEWLLTRQKRGLTLAKDTPTAEFLQFEPFAAALAFGDARLADVMLRVYLSGSWAFDPAAAGVIKHWGARAPTTWLQYVLTSPHLADLVAKYGPDGLPSLFHVVPTDAGFGSKLNFSLERLQAADCLLASIRAPASRDHARSQLHATAREQVRASLQANTDGDPNFVDALLRLTYLLDDAQLAGQVASKLPTIMTHQHVGEANYAFLFKWLERFSPDASFARSFLRALPAMLKFVKFVTVLVQSAGASQLPPAFLPDFCVCVFDGFLEHYRQQQIEWAVAVKAFLWLRRRRACCCAIYRAQGKRLVDLWLETSSLRLGELCDMLIKAELHTCSLLLPLFQRRAEQLRSLPGVVTQADFSWAMPYARCPAFPALERFLKSKEQTTTMTGFKHHPHALSFCNEWCKSTPDYSCRALEPAGRGKSVTVSITKTLDWSMGLARQSVPLRAELARLEGICAAIIQAKQAKTKTKATPAGTGAGAGPASGLNGLSVPVARTLAGPAAATAPIMLTFRIPGMAAPASTPRLVQAASGLPKTVAAAAAAAAASGQPDDDDDDDDDDDGLLDASSITGDVPLLPKALTPAAKRPGSPAAATGSAKEARPDTAPVMLD